MVLPHIPGEAFLQPGGCIRAPEGLVVLRLVEALRSEQAGL